MELHVGTSGFSYKEWKGSFYPEELSAKDMLSYYGERLNAVEINNTFYRLAQGRPCWRAGPPRSRSAFRFSIKASRRITHFARLKEEARGPTEYLLIDQRHRRWGSDSGSILFQLPPNLKKDLDAPHGLSGNAARGRARGVRVQARNAGRTTTCCEVLRARGGCPSYAQTPTIRRSRRGSRGHGATGGT